MKQQPAIIPIIVMLLLGAFLSVPVWGQGIHFHTVPPGEITITGHASLGDWHCKTRRFEVVVDPGLSLQNIYGELALAGQGITPVPASAPNDLPPAKPEARATIVVSTLDCTNHLMRADLLRALKAADFPFITYGFKRVDATTLVQAPGEAHGHLHLVTSGNLELAGVTRLVQVLVDIEQTGADRFELKVKTTLKMSDFGIDPPTALFGLIKAGDTVTITGDMTLAPGEAADPVSTAPGEQP